jgi:hypothetical protein
VAVYVTRVTVFAYPWRERFIPVRAIPAPDRCLLHDMALQRIIEFLEIMPVREREKETNPAMRALIRPYLWR